MNQKMQFVSLATSGRFSVTQLCEDFAISRKTGHKWLSRYAASGASGLRELSRRPQGCSHQTPESVLALMLMERKAHPTWGPKKIQDLLHFKHRLPSPPACSTIAAILQRKGLIKRRRRRPGVYHPAPNDLTQPTHPNHVWTFDFKGWFLTQDQVRCDPLTVCDRYSRYIVGCRALPNQQHVGTYHATRHLMRYHGLPEIIRVDNGSPFASVGWARLSRLSVWWITQGIQVEFTHPGHPQDNGSVWAAHGSAQGEKVSPGSRRMSCAARFP